MSLSPTEDTIRFLGELAEVCRSGMLYAYVEEWLGDTVSQQEVAQKFEQAKEAMQILNTLGEYIIDHNA